jgi:hypothetical protein
MKSSKLFTVGIFSIAMAWMEAAAVVYLRTLVHRITPYQLHPLPGAVLPAWIELVREAATLVMLISAAWLAGSGWRNRSGYFLFAFGMWDIIYYVFLKVIIGWPATLFDWDVLFLLPVPWWGPVLAPVLIALTMMLGGILLSRNSANRIDRHPHKISWLLCAAGFLALLYLFMHDSLAVLPQGKEAVENILPTDFNWIFFAGALCLMASPILDTAFRLVKRHI